MYHLVRFYEKVWYFIMHLAESSGFSLQGVGRNWRQSSIFYLTASLCYRSIASSSQLVRPNLTLISSKITLALLFITCLLDFFTLRNSGSAKTGPTGSGEVFWSHFQLRIFSSIKLFFQIIENNQSPWNLRLLHVIITLILP